MIINNTILLINNYNFLTFSAVMVIALFSTFTIIIAIYLEKKYDKKYHNIRYREELFNSLCTHINDIFAIFEMKNSRFEYISPNMEKTLGINKKFLIKNPFIFLEYTDQKSKNEIITYFMNDTTKNNFEIEYEFYHPKLHQTHYQKLRIYPVFNQQEVIHYICNISDLTAEKHSQQILKDALLNAQKANEAKKEFLSHISHELRTPINAVLGMAQIASNSLEDKEKVQNCLNKINHSSNNLLAIISNLLEMVKIDSDKLMLTKEPFCMSEFLYDFSSTVHTQFEKSTQEFSLILTDILDDYLIGDSLRLGQILTNCVSNALKFTPSGGKIKLEVAEIENHTYKALYRFIVTDNGKGMNDEYINRIFTPFEQEDSTIAIKYGGSGLGMSITKNLVNLMGGSINVTSKLDLGTTITIDIVFDLPYDIPVKEVSIPSKTSLLNFDFTGHRVLVVEDNDINLEITCELLKYVKLSYDTASNGYEAITHYKDSPLGYYDVILMDVQMPGLNGFETAKVIRNFERPDSNSLSIIAISADPFAEDITLTSDSGIDYYLSKPFDNNYFYSMMDGILSKNKKIC